MDIPEICPRCERDTLREVYRHGDPIDTKPILVCDSCGWRRLCLCTTCGHTKSDHQHGRCWWSPSQPTIQECKCAGFVESEAW